MVETSRTLVPKVLLVAEYCISKSVAHLLYWTWGGAGCIALR